MKREKPALVVCVSDLHAGSTLGLCHADGADLDDGGKYLPSVYQRWLWARWLEFVDEAAGRAVGRRVYVALNGDLVDGQVKESQQVVTASPGVQQEMALAALAPIMELADRLFVVRGTEAHTGKSAVGEEMIARALGAERGADVRWSTDEAATWWTLRAEWGGVLWDFAHHTSASRLAWTSGNAASRLAAEAIVDAADRHEPVPRMVVRSHVHRSQDSYENYEACRAIIMPAWQLRTAYGHRIAARLADIGGLIAGCHRGELEDVRVRKYRVQKARVWHEDEAA